MSNTQSVRLRNINLIEVLSEELEELGLSVDEPEGLAERTEDEIRRFFQSVRVAKPAEPDPETFRRWFPGFGLSGTSCENPKWQVLCFPNAGNAEDMYTSEGTGARRTPSPLLEWCRINSAECLAVQLPGRNLRRNEQPFESCQKAAEALLPVIASRVSTYPYAVVAHSVGTWIAFEFLRLAANKGLPMPQKVFFSAMAAPDMAASLRPWRQQHLLTELDFKEECRSWDVNEVVFSPAMWETYHPLMRADFRLFDQYTFQQQGEEAFDFPLTAFWGTKDRKITKEMVEEWRRFTSGRFIIHEVQGNHLWPLQAGPKTAWLSQIADELSQMASS